MPKKSDQDQKKELIILKDDAEFILSCLEPFKEGFISGYSWGRLPRENLRKLAILYNDILAKARKMVKGDRVIRDMEALDTEDFNEFDLLMNAALLYNHIFVE